jgi:hypothetical protein
MAEAAPERRWVTLDGTEGAGRIVLALAELGAEVDEPFQLVVDPDASAADLRGIDVGSRFRTVAQGSHLLNLPDRGLRHAYLELTRRLVADSGAALIEHHPLDWLETAAPTSPTPGVGSQPGMEDVVIDPPFVTATSVYDIHGHEERVPFRAQVLSHPEIEAELRGVGLALARRLSPTWVEARPS